MPGNQQNNMLIKLQHVSLQLEQEAQRTTPIQVMVTANVTDNITAESIYSIITGISVESGAIYSRY